MDQSPLIAAVAELPRGIDGAIIAPVGHLPGAPQAVRDAVDHLLNQRHYPPVHGDFAGAVEIAGVLITCQGDDPWTVGTPIALPNGRVATAASTWRDLHMHNLDWEAALQAEPQLDQIILR